VGPAKQNNLAHNGSFLDYLYASPGGKKRGQDYSVKKEKIMTSRRLSKAAKEGNFPTVTCVSQALSQKGITVTGIQKDKIGEALNVGRCMLTDII